MRFEPKGILERNTSNAKRQFVFHDVCRLTLPPEMLQDTREIEREIEG